MGEPMQAADRTAAKKLGEFFLERKLITEAQLESALQTALQQDKKVGQVLLDEHLITPLTWAAALSAQLNVPIMDVQCQTIDPEAVRLVPEELARHHCVIAVSFHDGVLQVATADPQDVRALEDVRTAARTPIRPLLALRSDIEAAIDHHYRATGEIHRQIRQIAQAAPAAAPSGRATSDMVASSPLVRAVDLIISQAVRDRASDVHIEPQRDSTRVRYRIDGILHEAMTLPQSVHAAMVSRLKVLAGMNIADRRRPQDGQFTTTVDGTEVDIRVATIEAGHGEMVVLRLLNKSVSLMQLSELGYQPGPLELFQRMLRAPYGAIFCAGPTGSGKTTTLYAALNAIDRKEKKVITIEDPVEYRFDDVSQVQVNRLADITFANGLRAIMRLDPDVILVGEIRDAETAEMAVQSALTGHLVLSSVHANDAVGALFRLVDLGVEPVLLTYGTLGAVSQRLVRRIDLRCREPYTPTEEERALFQAELGEAPDTLYRGAGCNFCANTGFLGRIAVLEVLTLTENLRTALMKGGSHSHLRDLAIEEGMLTLRQDSLVKAKAGITTVSEVIRNAVIL